MGILFNAWLNKVITQKFKSFKKTPEFSSFKEHKLKISKLKDAR